MISFHNFRPFLKIGRYQVSQYDDLWLREALMAAGEAAQVELGPIADDLLAGVSHYLEKKCSLQVLEVEALLERITKMLKQVGFGTVAKELGASAPPVTIPLDELAEACELELAFFATLREDVEDLRARGVRELRFSGLREASQRLLGTKTWNRRCELFERELTHFLTELPSCLSVR